jgi:GNAT superfamily N-acetyltransferase
MISNENYKIASGGEGFIIRRASRFEINFAIEAAASEGWNPGVYDGDSFYSADPQGFFVGTIERSIIGCISAINYGSFGFIGFYIIKPEFRGKGYGIKLWNTALDYLKGVKCIGLDGVIDQQNNYRNRGLN